MAVARDEGDEPGEPIEHLVFGPVDGAHAHRFGRPIAAHVARHLRDRLLGARAPRPEKAHFVARPDAREHPPAIAGPSIVEVGRRELLPERNENLDGDPEDDESRRPAPAPSRETAGGSIHMGRRHSTRGGARHQEMGGTDWLTSRARQPHAQRRERTVVLLGWHLRSDRRSLLPRRRHRPDQARGPFAAHQSLVRRSAGQGGAQDRSLRGGPRQRPVPVRSARGRGPGRRRYRAPHRPPGREAGPRRDNFAASSPRRRRAGPSLPSRLLRCRRLQLHPRSLSRA